MVKFAGCRPSETRQDPEAQRGSHAASHEARGRRVADSLPVPPKWRPASGSCPRPPSRPVCEPHPVRVVTASPLQIFPTFDSYMVTLLTFAFATGGTAVSTGR